MMRSKAGNMKTKVSRLTRCEDGGALIETALTLPVLVLLVLGAAEFSRVAYASLEVVSAAKAGVSYGAQQGGMTTDTAGITYAARHDAENVPTLTVSSISSSYACSDGTVPTSVSTSMCSTSHIEQTLTVQTQAVFDPLIHVPGLPTTYTIKGRASQLCQQ